ncbi:uncharacterized protein LOC123864238 [Maniola jurtina]|uniref:uncharacterized protein LOC123864238 n=1 Tax=Maniola jurtina TaxID=191418 RepID=UPI001E68DDD5|nr:uncharacterized protein LOC123864238 [Maniola jurtina]XP_045760486.1 uncharacterized protein LOC123864238 [Maniola jurtina]XP_045760487.1 uncharacterized protein LOC123864238 [Maniola jurtina]
MAALDSDVVEIEDGPDASFAEDDLEVEATQVPRPPKKKKKFQNDRYNNAYGDYSGGYGPPGSGYGPPGGGFGPPGGGFGRNFGRGPRYFGPPPPMFGPGPQGPPPLMWGRGFGPEGPPMRRQPMDDRTIRYLMRCGVAKEHLKNLPRDMLQLMEPEYCGLCGHSFESFATSRLHYVSKNHLKSQKKWLNQQSEVDFRRPKQVALKARELYCELCDVHITSKSHSDSHYAGRPHRAIVEGRKMPKNPFLLQPGMEDRVSQLIRREKKHLKAVDEEEEEEKVKEVKNTQPELYCDICKTSVTCTEQMTMHLNGKRHLSKEKQHILQMMKGGADDSTADATQENFNEDMEVAENGNEKEEGAKEVIAEDNFDWGNGSGAWDETKKDDDVA